MPTQAEKGAVFRALHHRDRVFVLANPWDVGTARMLTHLGFEALATTSAGYAFSIGQRDNAVGRERMLAHIGEIVGATDLPVSADLERGFGDDPGTVAETIALAAKAGLVGASIEDFTGDSDHPVFEPALAAERVRAAAEVARALSFPFMLTARAENFIVGRRDLDDTIRRLQAYQEAGADVLYAPGIKTREEISAVVGSLDRPVNVLGGLPGMALTLGDLSRLGVKRVSVGSGLARAALGAFLRAARELREQGTFSYAESVAGSDEISAMMKP